jgi:Fe-S cluster assembly scaffold protein SufB
VLGESNGSFNRGVKADFSFLDGLEVFENVDDVECNVEKLNSFEQICGKVVQKDDLPVVFLKIKGRKALHIEISSDVEKYEVDISDVGYLCIKVEEGVSGVVNLIGNDKNSCLLEGVLEKNSELELNVDVCESDTVFVSRLRLEDRAKLELNVADMNVVNGYFDVKNFVEGVSAEANVNWVYLSGGKDKKNVYVANYFQNKNCNGKILVKGVQEEQSRVTFLGEINIGLEGGGTDSYLKEDVMMLDESSYIEAIPSLEIKTNDVKAGHGVAISKITEDRLFYLQSRGLDGNAARKLLKQGFLKSGYAEFSDDRLVDKLDKIIML